MKKKLSLLMVALIAVAAYAVHRAGEAAQEVIYALATGDTFTSGQTVEVKNGDEVVATITYGETGGEAFKAAKEAKGDAAVEDFAAYTEGNGTNGNKTGGTFYTIKPVYDGEVSVAVILNADKEFYVLEDGTALEAYNGIKVSEKYYGTYTFSVTANKSYKFYCSGSKLSFYGFKYKYNASSPDDGTVATISELVKLEDKAAFTFTGTAYVVAKPTDQYVYIKDDTGSSLIYDKEKNKTQDLGVGVAIAPNWTGTVSIYNGLFEVVPDAALTVNGTSAIQVTYDEATLADITAANVNKIVKLTDVTVAAINGKNFKIKKGDATIAGYNQFAVEGLANGLVCAEMVGAIGCYNDNIQFQPISFTVGTPAPEPVDVTISPASGDISAALLEATELCAAKNITINLTAGGVYTISSSINAPASVTINGNGATIDASTLTTPMIKMAASAEAPTEITKVDGISFKDVTVKGLKKALFYSTQKKYDIAAFTIENCVIELAANVTTIDFTKGSAARVINVTKSTIYAPTATTKSFYSSQSGEKVIELDANATQTFAFNNNTIYNLAKGNNFFTHRQNSQKWLAYTATNNIFVNVGKSGQVMQGMNGGGQSTNPTWIADGNAFNFDGADTSGNEHPSASSDDVVKNSVAGVMAFTSTETPDFGGTFELAEGATAPSALGDPRWSITFAAASVVLWSSEEPVAMPSDWSGSTIQIAAEKLADANVGDILHVAVEGVTATDLWGAQVAPYDGAWHQLENGVPVGGGNVTDAAFVVTGDMLKLMKANGLQMFGAGYSTKKISLEPGVCTGSENSVWVGDVTLNWTQATVQKFHFINTDVKAGDIIKLTYESTGTPNIMLVYGWGETDKYGTFYDVPTAEYVVKEADVAILKDKGLIVNAAGIRLTQIELIPKPDTYVVAGNLAAIFGTAWDATNEYNKMTKNADGTYSMSYTVEQAYSGVQLKVVKNGSEWYGDANGNNVTFNLTGAGEFTVTYNPTTNEVTVTGDNVQSVTFEYTDVYAVGNGSGNWLNGKLWDQAAAENKMTKVSDGVFEITYQNVPAGGPYQVKFAFDGSWTYNFGGTFATFNEATDAVWDGGNIEFNLANAGDVTLRLDLTGFDFSTKQGAKFTITGGEDSYVVAGAVGEKDGGAKDFMFGTAWDATAEANKMTKNEDTGLYEKTFEGVAFEAAATISYKIVKNGSTWIPDGDNQTCEIPAAGTYNIVATFNPETKEATMTATAAGPQTIDVEIKNLAGGSSITAAITEAAKGGIVKNLTLSLKGGAYTVEAPIETAGNVSISGNGTIDASALAGDAFIVLNGTEEFAKKADGTDSDHKLVNSVKVSGVTVTGLTTAFIKDAQKTLLEELTVENCVIEMPAAGKNFIDFSGKGYVGNVKVSKSTIWAKGKNTGFFAQYGSRPKNVDGNDASLLQQFDVKSSTIVNIANGKNFCDLKQNGTAQNVYYILENIFVDCGKSGQTVVGFNRGQTSATPVWDVDGNTFMFGGASTNAAEVEKAGKKDGEDIVQNCVEGDPEFKDAANGDFTVGDQAPQQLTRTGDPRWLGIYKPEAVTAAIELTPLDGADLAMDLAEAYQEQGLAPAYITINLLPGGHYTVSQPMEINATINIIGDEANPATIDLNDCSGAMVQYSSTIAPAFTVNNLGFYEQPFNVVFKNVIFSRVKNQLFYANKQKYLVEYFTFENCLAEYLGGSKTIFDFNGGGVVENLTINNSTIYGNSNDGMKHEGALFSSQSGNKVIDAGPDKIQTFTITNSTLYNIANGKNVMTHRQNSQIYLTYVVKNNVIFNCGKKGQFCQGLNGGGNSANPMYYVHYNSFMWYADGVLADVDDTCGDKNPNVVTASWKNTYPESAVTDVFPKFFGTDEIGQYNNFFRGNFTVADGSVQKTNSVGDPRWLKSDNEYTDIQGISADKMMEGAWYTIQGVRVDQPTKGLYIHNGKKVVLK
jgi:hypothetical protein